MKKRTDILITNPWIELAARLCLGLVFVYASIHKIIDPGSFARIIYGYGLFPAWSINLTAIILPYVELTAGLCLIVGIVPRSAAVLVEILLLAFIVAIVVNLARGHEFDCGCFSFQADSNATAGKELLIRDMLWFAVGLVAGFSRSKRKFSLME